MTTTFTSPFDFRHLVNPVSDPSAKPAPKKPIKVYVVHHKDIRLDENDETRLKKNFNLIKSEFKEISGQDIEIDINNNFQLRDFQYNYKGDVFRDLNAQIDYMKRNEKKPGHGQPENHTKYVFITPDGVNGKPGIGAPGRDAAIASLSDDRGVAHAIGAMHGATKGDAEVNYHFPWWYETIMNHSDYSSMHGNDYRFSEKNRENIRKYLGG